MSICAGASEMTGWYKNMMGVHLKFTTKLNRERKKAHASRWEMSKIVLVHRSTAETWAVVGQGGKKAKSPLFEDRLLATYNLRLWVVGQCVTMKTSPPGVSEALSSLVAVSAMIPALQRIQQANIVSGREILRILGYFTCHLQACGHLSFTSHERSARSRDLFGNNTGLGQVSARSNLAFTGRKILAPIG